MMTSRAEYRLLLRQDNADLRLTSRGREVGLVTENRLKKLEVKIEDIEIGQNALKGARFAPDALLSALQETMGDLAPENIKQTLSGIDALKRDGVTYAMLKKLDPTLPDICPGAAQQIEIMIRYEGYLKRQESQMAAFARMEEMKLPEGVDYMKIDSLRIEARQKLNKIRPETLGQAARISGVSPGDISVLMVWLEKKRREEAR